MGTEGLTMPSEINRRNFIKSSLALSAGGALAARLGGGRAAADEKPAAPKAPAAPAETLPMGKLGKFQVSRMLLGGNLLTCYTHARDLRFVYKLIKSYNTDEKILETLGLAEQHGINTLAINILPGPMRCSSGTANRAARCNTSSIPRRGSRPTWGITRLS